MPSLPVAIRTRMKEFREKMNTVVCRNDLLREVYVEFLGTFVLLLVGNGVTATLLFGGAGAVSLVAAPIGWGLALMIGISLTGGVSGCHANPAVTFALATVGKLEWKKVLPYFFAQYVGAFVASAALFAMYYETFDHFDGGTREIPPHPKATAQIFTSYVAEHVSILAAVGDQIVGTALLMLAVGAVTDPRNMGIPSSAYPLMIGFSLSAIIFAFPLNCGAPLNPARDLAPRMFTAVAGWGKGVFSFRNYNYFWVPVVGPHIGAVIGTWTYRLMIEQHWPVDSYDTLGPTEIKTNGETSGNTDDLPFVDKRNMVVNGLRKIEE